MEKIWHQSMHFKQKRLESFKSEKVWEIGIKSVILGRVFHKRPPMSFYWRFFDIRFHSKKRKSYTHVWWAGYHFVCHYHFVTNTCHLFFFVTAAEFVFLIDFLDYSFLKVLLFIHLRWISFSWIDLISHLTLETNMRNCQLCEVSCSVLSSCATLPHAL